MFEFNHGDIVKLNQATLKTFKYASHYYRSCNPVNMQGQIIGIRYGRPKPFRVKWKNGISNAYSAEELVRVQPALSEYWLSFLAFWKRLIAIFARLILCKLLKMHDPWGQTSNNGQTATCSRCGKPVGQDCLGNWR
jgi:hypothetical protein